MSFFLQVTPFIQNLWNTLTPSLIGLGYVSRMQDFQILSVGDLTYTTSSYASVVQNYAWTLLLIYISESDPFESSVVDIKDD